MPPADGDNEEPTEPETEDMDTQIQTTPKQPQAGRPITPLLGEEEHLRARLADGRTVRVLFQGPPPTRGEIDKLIAMLTLSKDQYPERLDG